MSQVTSIIREKNTFNVENVDLYFQSNVDYLAAVMVIRVTKKTTAYVLHIFRLKQPEIPIDIVEFPITEHILKFQWEPNGKYFAIIHTNDVLMVENSITFYKVTNKKIVKVITLTDRKLNSIFFAPNGQYCVLAGINTPYNGQLEFYDVYNKTTLCQTDHYQCNNIQWDPSSRYVTSSIHETIMMRGGEKYQYTFDNGYQIFTFQGDILTHQKIESLYQFNWRPRNQNIEFVPNHEMYQIKDNLRSLGYYQKYEAEDAKIKESQISIAAKKKQTLKEQWKQLRIRLTKNIPSVSQQSSKESADEQYVQVEYEELIEIDMIQVALN